MQKQRYKRDENGHRIAKPGKRNPAAKKNAKPATRFLIHGANAMDFLTARLDRRSTAYKLAEAHKAESIHHLGGNPSVFEQRHIEQEARYSLLENLAFMQLIKQLQDNDTLNQNAFDAFNKAASAGAKLRETLGLKAQTKELALQDYINQREG